MGDMPEVQEQAAPVEQPKAAVKEGIKETVELTIAFLAIGRMLAEQFKDGLQAEDAIEIMKKAMTPELGQLIVNAYNGIDKVPGEIKDLSLLEVLDLLKICTPQILGLVGQIGKKA